MLCDIDIPEGYEFVRFGSVRAGDWYLARTDSDPVYSEVGELFHRVIMRPKFKLPDHVVKGIWYAKNKDGDEYLFSDKPQLGVSMWHGTRYMKLDRRAIEFPEYKGRWQDSLTLSQ